jgi:NAD dependent epimerase/dehydratase family enzyme
MFGEMADVVLLGGQKVLPSHALELGFHFRYPEIDRALEAIVAK